MTNKTNNKGGESPLPLWRTMPEESFIYAKVTKAEKWAFVRASRQGERPMKLNDWVRGALVVMARAQGCNPDDWRPKDQPHDVYEDERWNR